ncbi:MAG: cell surface protein [Simplicispira sp.]|nr:cell surface protein [Simplicispira sp.]
MKKNLLALSIAAMVGGLSGAANAAVFVNTIGASANGLPALATPAATTLSPTTSGIGHVLVVPYFSTQGTNKTLLSITNTDALNGKAVKLRFRGAANSDDVFDISIFLSPGDVWSADVGSDDGVISRLSTNDTSCTLPSIQDIKDLGGKFKLNRVQGEDAKQTREGYVEILNMADVPQGTFPNGANSPLYTAIKHVAGKAPCTPAVMDQQENELVAIATDKNSPLLRGYSWPTGGLSANWILVNTETMASFSGEAVALRAENAAGANGSGNIVWFPQTSQSASAPAATLTADPLLNSAGFASQVANYDFPDLSTPYFNVGGVAVTPAVQADNLANALATKSVINDVMTANGFATDWVFSMPTRRYAVALNYAAPAATRLLFRNGVGNAYFNAGNTGLNKDASQACVTPGGQRAYDREESTRSTFVISPDVGLTFCGETSVLSFNNAGKASVLNAAIARKDLNTTFAEGWFNINTVTAATPNGLPIVGFAAAKSTGINLGGTWMHRSND